MPRQIEDVEGVAKALKMSRHQVYKLVEREADPLPHKRLGRSLRFDLARVFAWFDSQPGRDETLSEAAR